MARYASDRGGQSADDRIQLSDALSIVEEMPCERRVTPPGQILLRRVMWANPCEVPIVDFQGAEPAPLLFLRRRNDTSPW